MIAISSNTYVLTSVLMFLIGCAFVHILERPKTQSQKDFILQYKAGEFIVDLTSNNDVYLRMTKPTEEIIHSPYAIYVVKIINKKE